MTTTTMTTTTTQAAESSVVEQESTSLVRVPDSQVGRPAPRRLGREIPLFREVSFDKLEKHLETMEEGNSDVFLPAKDIIITPEGCVQIGIGDQAKIFSFSDWAFSQLASVIGIAKEVLSKSPNGTGRASRKAIIDHWLSKTDKTILLRLKDLPTRDEATGATGRIRAFMATDVLPFSNRQLLSALRPWIAHYNMGIQIGASTEKSFHVRLLFREQLLLGTDGEKGSRGSGKVDGHCIGIHFRSSEVGFGPLVADLLVYRQVCANGMIAQTEKSSMLHKQHRFIDPATIGTEIGMVIEASRHRQSEVLDRLTALRDHRLEDPKATMQMWLRLEKVSETLIKASSEAYDKEPIRSRFGVLQAMTRAAQSFPLDGGRTELETLAGRYLAASV
jgi:hypothetical protein